MLFFYFNLLLKVFICSQAEEQYAPRIWFLPFGFPGVVPVPKETLYLFLTKKNPLNYYFPVADRSKSLHLKIIPGPVGYLWWRPLSPAFQWQVNTLYYSQLLLFKILRNGQTTCCLLWLFLKRCYYCVEKFKVIIVTLWLGTTLEHATCSQRMVAPSILYNCAEWVI